jgi:serine protease Do
MNKKPIIGLAVLSLLAGTVSFAASPPAAPSDATEPTINLRRTVTVRVVEETKGAVVNVSTTKLVARRINPMGADPFFQQFDFGQVVRVPANSLGSGFIIHKDGYVVTNNHVVDRARQIFVELSDGRKLPADLISTDADADLAILRIHSDAPLPTLQLGESNDLMIGEPVIAVGNPLGFSHSVSTGIVSAVHRDIDPNHQNQPNSQPVRGEEAALRDLIQTDAAINPGNSGGPLLNAYGQVIGINTAIRGDAQNIGFAIPIDRLRDLIPELMNPAQVTKVDVPLILAEKRTMTEPATVGCSVVSTGAKSQALEAINGQTPQNIVDAYAMLLRLKADQPFNVTWAGGKTEKFTPKPTPTPDAIVQARQRFGLSIEPVTPMLSEKMQLSQEDGLYIDGVDPGSVADKAGLKKGDIIVQLGRYRILSLDDFAALVQRLPASAKIHIGVVRGNEMGFGVLEY